MKFSAVLAAVAGAAIVSAQGYNSTSGSSTYVPPTDSRTLNVPKPSSMPPTAITSIDTITSSCGSVTVLLPGSTHVYPLSNGTYSGGTRTTSTYTGSSATSQTTGGAAKTQVAALAGAGGLALAALLL